jgi:hypothetical protein
MKTAPKQHPFGCCFFNENSSQTAPKQHPNSTQMRKNEVLDSRRCDFCNKEFTRKSGLTKHLRICKKNKNNKININELDKLKNTINTLLTELRQPSIINNTTNCYNNTVNIHINNYGEENTQYITKQYMLELLCKPFSAIPKLIKYIHFNNEHPENQNIKITNIKNPYVKVLKNHKWELQDKKEVIDELIDKQHSVLNNENIQKKVDKYLNEEDKDRLECFNDKYKNDERDLLSKLYKDSEMVIINNS